MQQSSLNQPSVTEPVQTNLARIQIADNLSEFPRQVFEHCDSLEILDLSNNQLCELPDDLDRLVNMRILFLSNNNFTAIPKVLARCPKLEMISFKSNQLNCIDEDVLPLDTRWLILTDNQITHLPNSIGRLHRLQKLALAGNCLTELPESMADCKNLELARLSANELTAMPDWLFQLPKLSWLAFSGNAFNRNAATVSDVTSVALTDIALGDLIGEGASGYIYRARWINQPESLLGSDLDIAVKIFKGSVTSDGYPQDELDNCLAAGVHGNLIKVIAQLDQSDQDKKLGLVMELISTDYFNLGLPPSLKTCTRDTFTPDMIVSPKHIAKIATSISNTLESLHENGISHGDIYAHNTMINDQANVLLGDFGAATNLTTLSTEQIKAMESIEVRALGCLLDDLLSLETLKAESESDANTLSRLKLLAESCLQFNPVSRPTFSMIQAELKNTLGH